MTEEDISTAGLSAKIARLSQDGVSNPEIESTLLNLCLAGGLSQDRAQRRVQEASHIWATLSTALGTQTATGTQGDLMSTESTHPGAQSNPPPMEPEPPAWLATLLTAMQATHIATPQRRRRQPDPDMFDGSRKMYQVFRQQLVAKVENDKDDLASDKVACDYSFSRLKGSAATLTLPFIVRMNTAANWNFDNLLAFFDQMFQDPHKEQRARDKLWSLRQGKKGVRKYAMEFQEHLLESNSTLDENTKIMIFKKGLDPRLQDKLVGFPQDTVNEVTHKAIEIADELHRIDFHSRNKGKTPQPWKRGNNTKSRSPSPIVEDTMEDVEYTGRIGKPRRLGSSELDQLRREGRCFKCREKGHLSASCTKKGKVLVSKAVKTKHHQDLKMKGKKKKEELSSDEEVTISSEEESDSGKE